MDIRLLKVTKIFSDGSHNAFTGMTRFNDKTYVTFRNADNHLSMDGKIIVIASVDSQSWPIVASLSNPAYDYRDPKIVTFNQELLLYFGGRTPQSRNSFVARSTDGKTFSSPLPAAGIPANHWLWHVKNVNGTLFGAAYHKNPDFGYSCALYQSTDGVEWQHCLDLPPYSSGETFLDCDSDGVIYALIRDDAMGGIPTLARIEPPYNTIAHLRRLPMVLQGPMLKRLPGGCLIICRQYDLPQRSNVRTEMFWLEDDAYPRKICTLPSGGDTSYAAWLDIQPGRGIASYYSAHEHKIHEPFENSQALDHDPAHPEHTCGADIFLADIAYKAD